MTHTEGATLLLFKIDGVQKVCAKYPQKQILPTVGVILENDMRVFNGKEGCVCVPKKLHGKRHDFFCGVGGGGTGPHSWNTFFGFRILFC